MIVVAVEIALLSVIVVVLVVVVVVVDGSGGRLSQTSFHCELGQRNSLG
jgi:hypothetical protein